jgi:flagellar biosynthesis/type III secretory pathway M-ring protein FliF/YscJ
VSAASRTVTRDDIEAKLAEIGGEVREVGERAKAPLLAAGAAAVVVLVVAAYFVGRRKGRKRTTIVEVRRV